tara:strand:+ start:6378 stop:6575 length:198 start_codon:yes stop_codon:yes gene_type:complete
MKIGDRNRKDSESRKLLGPFLPIDLLISVNSNLYFHQRKKDSTNAELTTKGYLILISISNAYTKK